MKIDRNEVVRLLERLSNAKGPSGFEDEVIDVVRDFCDGWATVEENTLRDGLIVPNGTGLDGDRARPRVMMDAHGDEVGGMVRTIRAKRNHGFCDAGTFFPKGLFAVRTCWCAMPGANGCTVPLASSRRILPVPPRKPPMYRPR